MRLKTKLCIMVTAVVMSMTALSFNVFANTEIASPTATPVVSQVDTATGKLTPNGNLTSVDDVHQTSEASEIEDKQFITVQSKNGNYFYIIIDRSGDAENVYFLNAVDEADLESLIEEETAAAECTCTDKCETGKVNVSCKVCGNDMSKCAGKVKATEAPTATAEPQAASKSSSIPAFVCILFVLLGGGAALYWFKFRNKKTDTKGIDDLDDYDYGEDDDYEDIDEEDSEIEEYEEDIDITEETDEDKIQ